MYHIFYIHSSGFFPVSGYYKNKAAMNIVEHVSLLPVGTSSGYMPRRGIAGSSGSTMSNFLRNHQTDFQSGRTSLQSHQQWRSVPLSLHPRQHLLSPEFFILSILPDIAVSCEAMPMPGKYRSGCSQSSIGWNTGPPMEELEKVAKKVKGSATL